MLRYEPPTGAMDVTYLSRWHTSATALSIGALRWYRFKRCGGTDTSAMMVPFRQYEITSPWDLGGDGKCFWGWDPEEEWFQKEMRK